MTFEDEVIRKLDAILDMLNYKPISKPDPKNSEWKGVHFETKIPKPVDLVPTDIVLELKEKHNLKLLVTAAGITIHKPWIEDPDVFHMIHQTLTEEGYVWKPNGKDSRWELVK